MSDKSDKPAKKAGRPGKITEDSIRLAENCMSRCLHRGEVKAALKKAYGISARTAERIMAKARDRLVEMSAKSIDEHRLDALAFYKSIIRSAKATEREKLLAQERICELLGLNKEAAITLKHEGIPEKAKDVDYAAYIALFDRISRENGPATSGEDSPSQ